MVNKSSTHLISHRLKEVIFLLNHYTQELGLTQMVMMALLWPGFTVLPKDTRGPTADSVTGERTLYHSHHTSQSHLRISFNVCSA